MKSIVYTKIVFMVRCIYVLWPHLAVLKYRGIKICTVSVPKFYEDKISLR